MGRLTQDSKAEFFENARHMGGIESEACETVDLAPRKINILRGCLGRTGDSEVRGFAAADVEHEMGGEFRARDAEGRINAALETVARVGHNAEGAARAGDGERVPQRRFDQHVGGRLVTARRFAAHNAGNGFDAVIVGDDDHRGVEPVGLAVQSDNLVAFLPAAHDEGACDLVRIEHVQRTAAVEGQIIGDVDERVDGPQADRGQPLLHPGGRRAILDAAHEAQGEGGCQMRVVLREVEFHGHRAGERASGGLDRMVLQLAETRRREIARNAVHAGGVGAVGGEIDLDDRIAETREIDIALPGDCCFGQFDDAVVIF